MFKLFTQFFDTRNASHFPIIPVQNPMIFMDEEREPLIRREQPIIEIECVAKPLVITAVNVKPLRSNFDTNLTNLTNYSNYNGSKSMELAFECIDHYTRFTPIRDLIKNESLTKDEAIILIELLDEYLLNKPKNKDKFRRRARELLLNYVYGEEIILDEPIANNGLRRSKRIATRK